MTPTDLVQPATDAELDAALGRVLTWSAERDYSGYSKMDLFNSRLMRILSLGLRLPRLIMTGTWSRTPIDLRPWVGVRPSRNPKGIGLFAMAHLHRYESTGDEMDRCRVRELLDWLVNHPSPGFENKCWGYNHPWQSVHFYIPRHSPNLVVTGNVAYAFLDAYDAFGEERDLAVARSVVDFLLNDLDAPHDEAGMRSISYVPGVKTPVLNVNGLAAAVLVRVAGHTGEERLADEARRLIAFLVDKQTDYGAWHYAWPATSSHVKHDNYHTGNVLDWILEYSHRSGDDQFLDRYRLGLDYYRDHLFADDGRPKWMSHLEYPADAHSAAQSIVTFAKAGRWLDPSHLDCARRTASWALANLQAEEGYFYYQRGRFWTKRYTLMRWCNAWMAYALSLLALVEYELGLDAD